MIKSFSATDRPMSGDQENDWKLSVYMQGIHRRCGADRIRPKVSAEDDNRSGSENTSWTDPKIRDRESGRTVKELFAWQRWRPFFY
jgi:hypothetical protein